MSFPEYKSIDLVEVNSSILDEWHKEDAFRRVLKLRAGAPRFIFFEGPPSANGKPGIHHVMARSIKDAVCRYKTQTGYLVERKAGWDTHGLPVELGVEKMLGITKEDIGKKISVDDYNKACRREVMKYTAEWVNLTDRIGYWVDMENPYITYDNSYIETLWYLLKKIYDKGYLYKGYSIQPYSPAAGTGLSTHELNQPGCYRDVKDTTVVAQFEVVKNAVSQKLFEDTTLPVFFLAWTTTPWTLPSNTALCVGPNIEYVRVESVNPYTKEPAVYVVAKNLVSAHFNDKNPYRVIDGTFKGSELEGIAYSQLMPWVNPGEGAFRVILGDYVTTEDGTGIVHIAPTFGADDNKVAKAAGVPPMQMIDAAGVPQAMVDRTGKFFRIEDLDPAFVAEKVDVEKYSVYAGRFVKNAYDPDLKEDDTTLDIDLCVELKQQGKAFKIEKHVHTYPHCWRTDKPVLYYPLDSWFIKTTAVQDRMIELNKTITWKPESTGTGRFGKWLENIQDWNLSRSRYWGTPLPVWSTEDGKTRKCIGSVEELYNELDKAVKAGIMQSNPLRDKGFVPGDFSKENYNKIDLHRPYVDNFFLVSDNGEKMTRETDLIDVWFDSGSIPYAQEGLKNVDKPCFGQSADFIPEVVDKTRRRLYTLQAINTIVSDNCAYRLVIS
ncbi:MAG: isoleucine--tRNA ligase, partial [Bacteroidales bacterium]|nr:isoleucine--tRNA ligase [Candidatus Equibacterium intestinale]